MRLIMVIVFLSAAFRGLCAAEEPNSSKAKIAKALDAFVTNKESIGTFGTYVDGEHAILVLDPNVVKQKSVSGFFEAVVSAHDAAEWYRCDINHDVAREGVTRPSEIWETGITWRGEKYTFANQQERRRRRDQQPGEGRLPLFDPWTLSISSFGMFQFGNAGRDDYLRVQEDENLKEVRYLGDGIVRGVWVLPPKYVEKFEVDFAEGLGWMPVQTRTWIRAIDGEPTDLSEENWPVLHSVVKTKWRQWEDGRWFPMTIAVTGFSGPVKQPVLIDNWLFKFSWVNKAGVNDEWGKIAEFSASVLASKIKDAAGLLSSESD